ncbi:MAG: DNA-protecting protein DprA, partial [Chloroflexi bacterium]|nr:DNA-protecting protein DprA [Chloroflexota bacterium]
AVKYWVAFNRITGLGPKRFELLESHFGDLRDAWSAGPLDLFAAGFDRGVVERILAERPGIDPDREMERLTLSGIRVIPRNAPEYPRLLKETYDPPAVLYVRGELGETDSHGVAVVGTRVPTPYGRETAYRLAGELAAAGITVVSGLALGIDALAHKAALEAGGPTVAVLGTGPDEIFPVRHKDLAERIVERGALVTEYPLDTKYDAMNFPRRNRVLSGLARGTLVVEAGMRSGALITVKYALEQNREVFAVPGSILSEKSAGTNWLIQQGAKLVVNCSDILEELNILSTGRQLPLGVHAGGDDLERLVLSAVTAEPVHIDDVIRTSGLPSSTVSAALTMMELRGLVRQAGPLLYSRTAEASAT